MGRGSIPESLLRDIMALARQAARGNPPRIALHPHTVTLLLGISPAEPLVPASPSASPPVAVTPTQSEAPPNALPSLTGGTGVLPGLADGSGSIHEAVARCDSLDAVADLVRGCTRCHLHATRTHAVPGEGNSWARLAFVGEAPGADEDAQGRPFVGRAGKLLTDIIEKGMGLRREDVYICNVLKCRPPGNRTPTPDEMALCMPYLTRQLELIRPEVIVALGGVAAQALLDTRQPVGRLRGAWHAWRDIPLRVTFHPAYLLRNPQDKAEAWKDIQEVMKRLGLKRPGTSST